MGESKYRQLIREYDEKYLAEMDRCRDIHDHDPVEDILMNDGDEVGGYCSYTDYLIMEQEDAYEIMMGNLAKMIQDEKQYGHIMEAADKYYEELEHLEAIAGAAPRNAMAQLELSAKEAEQYGCHMDKHFYYEAMDIMAEDSADDNYGDGDPSQWEY